MPNMRVKVSIYKGLRDKADGEFKTPLNSPPSSILLNNTLNGSYNLSF